MLALKDFLKDFLRWVAGKSSRAGVSLYAKAFSTQEPERLVGSGLANTRSMRQNGGKTMVPGSDRSVARGTCHMLLPNPCKKVVARGSGQSN